MPWSLVIATRNRQRYVKEISAARLADVPTKRTYNEYGDRCAAAHALDLVGDRWSLIIVRELTLGPKRFNELLETLRGISPAVLSARLRELESYGVLRID